MVEIADLGNYESVPPFVTALMEANVSELDDLLGGGYDIQLPIKLSQSVREVPLALALMANRAGSVGWLVEHRADLNHPDRPSFPIAARYSDPEIMRYLAQHGANVDAVLKVGGDAYQQALYGKKIANLPIIEDLGHSVTEHAGQAFRSSVYDRNRPAVEFFLAHGVDVDFSEPDQVFSDAATPLLVATRNQDMEMCQLLVKYGADLLKCNRDGERPYTVAIEQGNEELATYLKSLEPSLLHSVPDKLEELVEYKLSPELLEFLQSEQRRIELSECDFGFVEFFALTDTFPMLAGSTRVLRLSRVSGDYSETLLVWNPETQRLGYWDIEQEEYGDIAPFGEFMRDPSKYMNGVLN